MWLVQITPMWYIVVLILDSEPAAKVEKPVGQTEGVEQLFRQYGQTVQGKVWNSRSYCLSGSRSYCRVGCGTVGHTVGQTVQGKVWNSRSYCLSGSRSYCRVGCET